MLDTVEGMSELQRIRVVIADDQELVRAGFAMVIGSQPDIQVVGQAGDGAQAVSLAESLHPDVVLMDVRTDWKRPAASARWKRPPETRRARPA